MGMKTKTSITLSADILIRVKRAGRRGESRSQTIERLLRERLNDELARANREREEAQINRYAEALNAEAVEVLDYQRNV